MPPYIRPRERPAGRKVKSRSSPWVLRIQWPPDLVVQSPSARDPAKELKRLKQCHHLERRLPIQGPWERANWGCSQARGVLSIMDHNWKLTKLLYYMATDGQISLKAGVAMRLEDS